jgi:IS4 transposase
VGGRKAKTLVLLTNHLAFGSTTVAAVYRERWQIEVFFRHLKQNLRIKTFVGTSANALHVQIWTAFDCAVGAEIHAAPG